MSFFSSSPLSMDLDGTEYQWVRGTIAICSFSFAISALRSKRHWAVANPDFKLLLTCILACDITVSVAGTLTAIYKLNQDWLEHIRWILHLTYILYGISDAIFLTNNLFALSMSLVFLLVCQSKLSACQIAWRPILMGIFVFFMMDMIVAILRNYIDHPLINLIRKFDDDFSLTIPFITIGTLIAVGTILKSQQDFSGPRAKLMLTALHRFILGYTIFQSICLLPNSVRLLAPVLSQQWFDFFLMLATILLAGSGTGHGLLVKYLLSKVIDDIESNTQIEPNREEHSLLYGTCPELTLGYRATSFSEFNPEVQFEWMGDDANLDSFAESWTPVGTSIVY